MATAAQVLLQLLEKVPDASKIERLMTPANLIVVLDHYGYDRETVKRRVKSGTLPGELLLELLEREPDANRLLAVLPAAAKTPAGSPAEPEIAKPKNTPAPAPMSHAAFAAPAVNTGGQGFFQKPYMAAMVTIISLTAILPALLAAGFFGGVVTPPTPLVATVIAVAGGIVAGAIFSRSDEIDLWKGVLLGVLLNIGVVWATMGYSSLRQQLFQIEIVIPLFVGGLPAFFLYLLIARKA